MDRDGFVLQYFVEQGYVCICGIWSSKHESDTPTAEGSADLALCCFFRFPAFVFVVRFFFVYCQSIVLFGVIVFCLVRFWYFVLLSVRLT